MHVSIIFPSTFGVFCLLTKRNDDDDDDDDYYFFVCLFGGA